MQVKPEQWAQHYGISDMVAESLRMYAEDRIPTGGFLEAVLSNDLKEAVFHADSYNLQTLREIVMCVHWELPHRCWGSPEKVRQWLEGRRADDQAAEDQTD